MRFSRPVTENMPRKERYTLYFESLRRAMELRHDWQSAYDAASNRCSFLSREDAVAFGLTVPTFCFYARFPRGDSEVISYLYIRRNHELFDHLCNLKSEIDTYFGSTLLWDSSCGLKGRRIFAICPGSILATQYELEEYGEWHIETLLKLNQAFAPRIRRWLARSLMKEKLYE